MLRVVNAVKSPWLKVTLDTGNFLENPYEQMAAIAPHAAPKPAATAQNTPAPTEAKPAQTNVQKAAAAPADRKATRNYVVRKNDNPVKIAREQGCNYDDLMKVNNIKDPKKIQAGQVLTIPVKKG